MQVFPRTLKYSTQLNRRGSLKNKTKTLTDFGYAEKRWELMMLDSTIFSITPGKVVYKAIIILVESQQISAIL